MLPKQTIWINIQNKVKLRRKMIVVTAALSGGTQTAIVNGHRLSHFLAVLRCIVNGCRNVSRFPWFSYRLRPFTGRYIKPGSPSQITQF